MNRHTRLPAPWQRIDDRALGKIGARYAYPGGWRIAHCGHPTALWPYLLTDRDGRIHLAPNGRAWPTLAAAAGYVIKVAGM